MREVERDPRKIETGIYKRKWKKWDLKINDKEREGGKDTKRERERSGIKKEEEVFLSRKRGRKKE